MKNTKNARSVFMLTCDDASHLGGPMGTEYTTTIYSKPFSTKEKAFAYAVKDAPKHGTSAPPLAEWQKDSTGNLGIDCRTVIFNIRKEKVDR